MERRKNKRWWKLGALAAMLLAFGGGGAAVLTANANTEEPTVKQARVSVDGTTMEYDSLATALTSIRIDPYSHSTITILTDIPAGDFLESYQTPKGERTTIDLNGKTVANGMFFFDGIDTVMDSSEEGTGTFAKKANVLENASLTVKGGNFHANEYPLYMYKNSSVNVLNGSFWNTTSGDGRDILITNGCKVSFKNAEFPNDGIGISGYAEDDRDTIAEIIDESAKFYGADGTTEVTVDVGDVESSAVRYIKQEYIATFEQTGVETVYLESNEEVQKLLMLDDSFSSSVDGTLDSALTLYSDVLLTSFNFGLSSLIIDVNGNTMRQEYKENVYSAFNLTSGQTLQIIDSEGGGLIEYGYFGWISGNEENGNASLTLNVDALDFFAAVGSNYSLKFLGGRFYNDTSVVIVNAENCSVSWEDGVYDYINMRAYDSVNEESKQNSFSMKNITARSTMWDSIDLTGLTLADVIPENYIILYENGEYEVDLTKNSVSKNCSIIQHTHDYSLTENNETHHWNKCGCGLLDESSREAHTYKTEMDKDEMHHWLSCSNEACGYIEQFEVHYYQFVEGSVNEEDMHVLKCGGCGDEYLEACEFYVLETVNPTLTEDGYYVKECECGNTYNDYAEELTALGKKTIATIGGLEMNLGEAAYYVNGENGGVGTVSKEEPETYNAKLRYEEMEDGWDIYLELNGLNVSVDGGAALIVASNVTVEVYGENNVTATNAEMAIGFEENIKLYGEDDASLNVTMTAADTETDCYAIHVVGDLEIDGFEINVQGEKGIVSEVLYVYNTKLSFEGTSVAIKSVGFNFFHSELFITNVKNGAGGVLQIDNSAYVYGSTIDLKTANDASDIIIGISANSLTLEDSQISVTIEGGMTPAAEEGQEDTCNLMYGCAVAARSLFIEESTVDVFVKNAGLSVGVGAGEEFEIVKSEIFAKGENVGMSSGVSFGDGYLLGVPNEGQESCMLVKDSDIYVEGEWGKGIGVNVKGGADSALNVYKSNIHLKLNSKEIISSGMSVSYAPEYDGGVAVTIEKSTVKVETTPVAQIHYGISVSLNSFGDDEDALICSAKLLLVKKSELIVEYGYQMMGSGIYLNADFEGYSSGNEMLTIEDSTVISRATSYSSTSVSVYESSSICLQAELQDYATLQRLVLIERSNVVAVSGAAMHSMGMKIAISGDYDGYVDTVMEAYESNLTFIGGDAEMRSAGLYLSGGAYSYGENGIRLIDCETLAISGNGSLEKMGEENNWIATTAAMYLEMETYDELLYIEGGHTALIAPEAYEGEFKEETITFNEYSYAVYLSGDDAEIVSGTLEMRAGRFCVYGDFDCEENEYIFTSESYGGDVIYSTDEDDVQWEEDAEEDEFKYVFIGKGHEYIAGLPIGNGEYYVNGKDGGVGEIYDEEPEVWNARLEYVFDEHGNYVKSVLTIQNLYISSKANSLMFAPIVSFGELEIVVLGENVIEANRLNEYYTPWHTSYVFDVRTYEEEIDEETDEYICRIAKGGKTTITGDGSLKAVGVAGGLTHVGDVYVAMDSYFLNGVYTLKNLEKGLEAGESWTVEAHAHVISEWIVDKAATCKENGAQHKECTLCGATMEEGVLDAIEHAYGEWTVVEEATKENAGLREKTCAHCGDKIAELIPEEKELSDGAIVGITIGSTVAGCSGIAVGLWFFLKKKMLGA